MKNNKEIIKSRVGVVLKRTAMFDGPIEVDVAFTVSSKRTPEVKAFENQSDAELFFAEELSRCL